MSEIETTVTPRKQEHHVPEYNRIDKLEKPLYLTKNVTRKSRLTVPADSTEGKDVSRSLANRTKRAELYKKAMATHDRNERKKLLAEAHARDEIEAQYLSQGEIKVNLPGMGEQMARYTVIEPPNERKKEDYAQKPPIVLIPGISNDLDSVGNLIEEIAYNGRQVVSIAMPDSFMGSVTNDFAKAVKDSPTLAPHTDFFRNAINNIVGQDGNIELWGHSTGAMVTAELLNDPEFQKRTTDAVLTSPVGVVDQSKFSVYYGNIVSEGVGLVKNFSRAGTYSLTGGAKDKTAPENIYRGDVFNAMVAKVTKKFPLYGTMKVRDEGSIIVVSGEKDDVTKSRNAVEEFKKVPNVKVLPVPNGIHNTPILNADTIIPQIFSAQTT